MNKDKNGRPVMEPMKVYVPPTIHKNIRMLSAQTGKTMSHLVSEMLIQYFGMAGVPATIKVPPLMAEAKRRMATKKQVKLPQAQPHLGMEKGGSDSRRIPRH